MRVKAVIFDLDGTLIDSEPNYFEANKRLMAEYGVNDFDEEKNNKYVGISTKETLQDLKAIYRIEDSLEVLLEKKNGHYKRISTENTRVYPEMRKLIGLLKERQIPLALASGSSREMIEHILNIANLKGSFTIVLSSEEVKRGKPAPDVFLEAAMRLGVSPADCLVMEDSEAGVLAAKRAGMHAAAIPYLWKEPIAHAFQGADLLFRGGMDAFTAQAVMDWAEGKE